MSKKLMEQEGGTKALLKASAGNLDAITQQQTTSTIEDGEAKPAPVPQKPRRVKKNTSLTIETIRAIRKIQDDFLENEGRNVNASEIIDEAVMNLLHKRGLSL